MTTDGAGAIPRSLLPSPLVALFTMRERARTMMRTAFPRRRARLTLTRTPEELDAVFRGSLVAGAIVDLAGAQGGTWRAPAHARRFRRVPFSGLTALSAGDACAAY